MAGAGGADAGGLPVSSTDLLRRRMINVIGHELRTPATTVRGLAEALAGLDPDGGADEQAELVEALVRASRRLEHLVEDLLLASSVTTLVPTGRPVSVELGALAAELWSAAGGTAPLAVEGEAVALVRGPAVRKALAAILDNAAGLGADPVSARAEHLDGVAVLEVSNAGPDLRPEELDLATEAFFRGEAAVTTRAGLGIGLAVARALLEAEGGAIALAARPGGGVVVTVRLPSAP